MGFGHCLGKYETKPLPEVDKALFIGIKGIDEIEDKLPHYYIKIFSQITNMIVWKECTWDGNKFRTMHDSGWLYKPKDCLNYYSVDDPEVDFNIMLSDNKKSMDRYMELSKEWLEQIEIENSFIRKEQDKKAS